MKLICIDNLSRNNKLFQLQVDLTIDKVYDVVKIDNIYYRKYYYVNDDRGKKSSYSKDRFITLKEYRKRKLRKLNECRL
jgi:hypothetical protein